MVKVCGWAHSCGCHGNQTQIIQKSFPPYWLDRFHIKNSQKFFLKDYLSKLFKEFHFVKKTWLPGSGAYFLCMVYTYSEFFENLFKNKWAVLKIGGGEISWWPSNRVI